MDFIEIGERIKLIGEIAEFFQRSDITVHRVDALKCNKLWTRWIVIFHKGAQVLDVIVTEDAAVSA